MVKVSVCELCSWELKHYNGILGKIPMTLGHEWAGVVSNIDPQVSGFSEGDKVAFYSGMGSRLEGFADYVC